MASGGVLAQTKQVFSLRATSALRHLFWSAALFLVGILIGIILYLTVDSYAMSDSLLTFLKEQI